jgi:hypothetical protein
MTAYLAAAAGTCGYHVVTMNGHLRIGMVCLAPLACSSGANGTSGDAGLDATATDGATSVGAGDASFASDSQPTATDAEAGPGEIGEAASTDAAFPGCPQDPCSCDPPNGDPAHAEPYALGSSIISCISSTGDLDYYEFETPANSPGGAVVVSVDWPGSGTMDPAVFVAGDTTKLFDQSAQGATSFWFAAAPSTRYLVEVQSPFFYPPSSPYTFHATYTAAASPVQPGGTKASATPLSLGTAVQALMFAGYTSDTINDTAWWQWYQLTLAAGSATVSITNVASDLTLEAYLYDATNNANTIHGYGSSASAGGSISFMTSAPVTAGTYYIQLEPVTYTTHPYGSGTTPGAFTTQPYTLLVTQ